MKIKKVCVCSKPFLVEAYKVKHGRGKFCSPECQYDSMRRIVSATCENCQRSFDKKQSSSQTYCSPKCKQSSVKVREAISLSLKTSDKAIAQRTAVLPTMHEFVKSTAGRALRRSQLNSRLQNPASHKVWMESIKKRSESEDWKNALHFQKGNLHPKYKGNKTERQTAMNQYEYKQWRTAVFERDDYTCQNCFKTNTRLNAHHIKHWSTNSELRYEISNGITLCETCHKDVHKLFKQLLIQ